MALWGVRAGRYGEQEQFALENGLCVVAWDEVPSLANSRSRSEVLRAIEKCYPDRNATTLQVWAAELNIFVNQITVGDLVALPLKTRAMVAVGEIGGPYEYRADHPSDARHCRRVRWIRTDMARTEIPQDILSSLGSTLTVFGVRRNDAEARLRMVLAGEQTSMSPTSSTSDASRVSGPDPVENPTVDIDRLAKDQIVEFIGRRFHGHEMARLVEAVLVAQGYRTYRSPPGPDGGVDIVAGRGALGFDPPRLCVQVKSGTTPQDIGVVRELRGVMNDVRAEHGLLVAWGGFRNSVYREVAHRYFEIRLWDSTEMVNQMALNYDQLSAEIQAELPLKRVWALVTDDV